ncbi:hypothetical protein [Stenotrophomonas sp.]|uniref:hypothetical protein n=1 Tax=Stenotrophomonas sp. TaxID=69392 RepID=UPI0028975143|nr:hypothetical protein [Stenotrophomonas sp.]
MSKEYGTAANSEVTVNPMRLPNTLHLVLGAVCFVFAGALLLGITNADTVRSMGVGAVGRLSIGVLMLLMGGLHIGMAMRYFRFTLREGEAGEIAVPTDAVNRNDYLLKVINDGIFNRERPADPLLNMLYGLVPPLSHAPATLRRHAEIQLQRAVYLSALLASFMLAWLFAQPAAFAWMAAFYFAVAVIVLKPMSTLRAIRKGTMEPDNAKPLPKPKWTALVSLLLMSIAGPLAITLSPLQIPSPPFATATVVLPTIAVLGSALIASALFIVALIAQTRHYASSGARHLTREDVAMQDLTRGLLERWHTRMPWPHKAYAKDHNVLRDEYNGLLMCETEPVARADQSASTLRGAFQAAWGSPTQRPLLGLGLLGLLLGISGVLFAFIYARSSGAAMVGLIALGFVSSAQFALASAHKLWNRVDFTSTLYRMSYQGTYHRAERVAGSVVGANGTLAEKAIRFGPLRVAVCVAQIESVAFSRDGTRHITAIDLMPEACHQQFALMQDYIADARQRAGAFYSEEHQVREVLAHGVQPPELPDMPEMRRDRTVNMAE